MAITKTDFMRGMQYRKMLWLDKHKPSRENRQNTLGSALSSMIWDSAHCCAVSDTKEEEMDQMDAMTALLTRRSTRNYLPKPVEGEKLDKLLAAARQAPSGGNNQTNHFLVIQNRDVLDKLVGMTESAFAEMEVDEDTYSSLRHAILASKKGGYVFCYNAPVLIVVANRRDYGNNMVDCACAIENIMVAANALDLGSCWINQLRWLNEEPALVEYLCSLGMKTYERVYGAVIVGYPATDSGLPNRNMMAQKGNF